MNSCNAHLCTKYREIPCMGGFRGGVQGVATPPNGQSHTMKYSAINVFSRAGALIYIAKRLVVVVVRL